ncbi:corticotropin-releasing factor-binding protein-like isoform X2 [Ptychodera flava]|uniref:corticotropin-releasing factor-binding protein-like isoform X2 n=1 Tax=Ptychodera flava TaxID=63121 RepID=UPI00396A168C
MVKYLPLAAFICCSLSVSLSAPYKDLKRLHINAPSHDLLDRVRRSSDIDEYGVYRRELDCFDILAVTGEFNYTSDGKHKKCDVYVIAEPDEEVVLEFTEFNVKCPDKMMFVDGWATPQGTIFPTEEDHHTPIQDRIVEFCDEVPKEAFVASQNNAMLHFAISQPGHGFRVFVTTRKIRHPCNAIGLGAQGAYTLRNFGHKGNCSFAIMSSSRVFISDMNVADGEDGVQCTSGQDVVQFLKSSEIGSLNYTKVTELCGKSGAKLSAKGDVDMIWQETCSVVPLPNQSKPVSSSTSSPIHDVIYDIEKELSAGKALSEDIPKSSLPSCKRNAVVNVALNCINSVVRLVSSGSHDNHVSFEFGQLEDRAGELCEA